MKNLFSICALFILFPFFKVSAQNCTPYAPVTVGYYPPSGNLPCAYNNAYYDITISYKGHNSSIYTAYVDSITNLPFGLSASYPTNSLVPGGTWCAQISGIPIDNCGQYKILIYISIPQVGVSGELTALSNANPGFFFANQGDNDNRIIRLVDNTSQPLVLPQNSPFVSTSCGQTNNNETSNTTDNVPGAISYQAVARDAQGMPLADTNVQVRFTLIADSIYGAAEYVETHTLNTNSMGLFTTAFGAGTPVSNTFGNINWTEGNKFLKVQIDTGNGLVDIGTQQLLSTPYSLHSATSGAIKNPGLPVFADNAAALAGGLVAGDMYRTASGDLKIVY